MTEDIYENSARALVGFDGKRGTKRLRPKLMGRLARTSEQVEGAVAKGAAALCDGFVRGLAMAACSHAAIPIEQLSETTDRR